MFCNKSCSAKFNNKGKNRHSVSSEKTINNIMDLSLKDRKNLLIKTNSYSCSCCGWDKDICDIHHIRGRDDDECNDHGNLTILCPNCHRLAHSKIIDSKNWKTIKQKLGKNWKNYICNKKYKKLNSYH
jgi:hypothetical protein